MQRETICELAARCGMTVSDYLLARSHDYEPKHRLTRIQTDALTTLNNNLIRIKISPAEEYTRRQRTLLQHSRKSDGLV